MQGVFISRIIDGMGMSGSYSGELRGLSVIMRKVPKGIKEIPRNTLGIS